MEDFMSLPERASYRWDWKYCFSDICDECDAIAVINAMEAETA
jgi:hypothetical protein